MKEKTTKEKTTKVRTTKFKTEKGKSSGKLKTTRIFNFKKVDKDKRKLTRTHASEQALSFCEAGIKYTHNRLP
mgnify:CR=1 FL=1